MKTNPQIFSKFKLLIALALGVLGAGLLYAQINIPTDLTNAVQTIKKLVISPDGIGSSNAAVTIDANSGTPLSVSGNMEVGNTTTNSVSGLRSSVLGGDGNTVVGNNSTIAGGNLNAVRSNNSTIPGGTSNGIAVGADSSFAAGDSAVVKSGHA